VPEAVPVVAGPEVAPEVAGPEVAPEVAGPEVVPGVAVYSEVVPGVAVYSEVVPGVAVYSEPVCSEEHGSGPEGWFVEHCSAEELCSEEWLRFVEASSRSAQVCSVGERGCTETPR